MTEKPRNLNLLRDALLAKRAAGEAVPVLPEREGEAVNTLEKFEALPLEEQLARMRRKEYDDLELFKQKHYGKGKEFRVDLNEVRAITGGESLLDLEARLPEQLKDAKDKFQSAGLVCETYSRGEGLEPWLKVALPGGDVYLAHQYNRIVSTERIPGFNCTTAGLGEFEYYVDLGDERQSM